MSVRKDEVQISIAFITDESKAYAKLINANKDFIKDLDTANAKIRKYDQELKSANLTEAKRAEILAKITVEEGNVAAALQKIADEAHKVEKIDLSKLTPSQLTVRAKQLAQAMALIPASAPQYKILEAEQKRVNDQLATMRQRTKGVAEGMEEVNGQGSRMSRIFEIVAGVFGGISLAEIVGRLVDFGKKLFGIGIAADFFKQKTATVFGEAAVIVQGSAEKIANSLGFTKREFIDAATRAGDLLVPMEFNQKAAAQLSVELTKQAGVLSQWSGGTLDAKEAHDVLTKALLGERDGLQALGIKISDDLVKTELRKEGQDKLTGAALRQATAMVTLRLVTEQSAAANAQYESTTANSVKTQAQLKARIGELTDEMATGLVPVFRFFLTVAERALTLVIALANGLAAIPQFVRENKVELTALVVAIATLNAQNIALAANTLRTALIQRLAVTNTVALAVSEQAAAVATGELAVSQEVAAATTGQLAATTLRGAIAQRVAAIASRAQATAQWLLNAALTANPIGIVIVALAALAAGLSYAYKQSETFREIVDAAFSAVKNSIANVVEGLTAFAGGFKKVFSGDFTGAAEEFRTSFEKLNPIGIGKALVTGFQKGYEEAKDKTALAKIIQEQEDAKQAKIAEIRAEDEKRAKNERVKISVNGTLDAKEAGKAKKEALDAAITEVELAQGREEIALDVAKLKREIGETEFARRIFDLKKSSYEQQLVVFKKYGADQQKEALETQKKLLELEATRPQKQAAVPTIGGRPLPGLVTSQTDDPTKKVAVIEKGGQIETDAAEKAIREKFARQFFLEGNLELELAQNRVNSADRKLDALREAGLAETDIFKKTLDEKAKADEDFHQKELENEKRAAEMKKRIQSAASETAKDAIDFGIELLGRDEKARKRNAGVIKAFEIGKVIVTGIQEVSKIWANAAELGPIAGPIYGGIMTGIAAGRSVRAVKKIRAEKFATGGFTGPGLPFTDETGHRPAGVVHGGEWVGPKWMVNSPKYAPIIRSLEMERLRGFAIGGNVPTTPVAAPMPGPSAAPVAMPQFDALLAETVALRKEIGQWQRNQKVMVVYSDIEAAGKTASTIRANAAL